MVFLPLLTLSHQQSRVGARIAAMRTSHRTEASNGSAGSRDPLAVAAFARRGRPGEQTGLQPRGHLATWKFPLLGWKIGAVPWQSLMGAPMNSHIQNIRSLRWLSCTVNETFWPVTSVFVASGRIA